MNKNNKNNNNKLPEVGILEWFRLNEHQRVEQILDDLKKLNVKNLRTSISWADWHTPEGEKWYEWFIPYLSKHVNILPCVSYTPPSLGIVPKTSAPPKNPKDYADFLDILITKFDNQIEWIELWNEPNNINDWDWRLDPAWDTFTLMITQAANWVKQRGKKTVLGGMAPCDPNWLSIMCQRKVLDHIDAVSIHGFPGTWEFDWSDWKDNISKVKDVIKYYHYNPEVWITEAGYSTWKHDEHRQICEFVKLIEAPVDRVYYYSAQDLHPNISHQDGFHEDERHYHFGLKKADGSPKLIYRIWENEGLEGLKRMSEFKSSCHTEKEIIKNVNGNSRKNKSVLVIGGAGFIGTNLSDKLLSTGNQVIVFDNLSRPGVEENLRWLKEKHNNNVQIEIGDIRNPYFVQRIVQDVSCVYNFAAQVAVTSSLNDPVHDFEVNVHGTINLLEALRSLDENVPLIFTSTNKVYGGLNDIKLYENGTRYIPTDPLIRTNGISEKRHLDFHSPYGCSKGAADQYILDYARSFDLPTAVFRMSCIYGPHQFGTEDQGWVAHFLIQALLKNTITIYGDGKQVRDILFVDDLVNAFLKAKDNIDNIKGNAFNIGGSVKNSVSLLELLDIMEDITKEKINIVFDEWRIGDQKYYVSDISKFREATGWNPKVDVEKGVENLYKWLSGNYIHLNKVKKMRKKKIINKEIIY